jgi:hypothetical protein
MAIHRLRGWTPQLAKIHKNRQINRANDNLAARNRMRQNMAEPGSVSLDHRSQCHCRPDQAKAARREHRSMAC